MALNPTFASASVNPSQSIGSDASAPQQGALPTSMPQNTGFSGLGGLDINYTAPQEPLVPTIPNFNQSYDIASLLEKNLYLFNYEQGNTQSPQQYLVYTKNAEKIINDIEKVCLDAWNYTFEGDLESVNIRYNYETIAERRPNNNSLQQSQSEPSPEPGSEAGSEEGSEDVPSWNSISHNFSTLTLSSKVELDFYEGPIGDAEKILTNTNIVSIEQDGPFYEASISYFRPPKITDLDVTNGFSSLSCSFAAEDGATTNISYSTSKYQNVDKSVITQVASSNINKSTIDNTPAFYKNSG
jgi:hypothetical protein